MGKRDRIKRSPGRMKLSIQELQEVVTATSMAKSSEGSSDEEQIQSFGSIQDSCELAKTRKVYEETCKSISNICGVNASRDDPTTNPKSQQIPSKFESLTLEVATNDMPTSITMQEQWNLDRQKEETHKVLALIAQQLHVGQLQDRNGLKVGTIESEAEGGRRSEDHAQVGLGIPSAPMSEKQKSVLLEVEKAVHGVIKGKSNVPSIDSSLCTPSQPLGNVTVEISPLTELVSATNSVSGIAPNVNSNSGAASGTEPSQDNTTVGGSKKDAHYGSPLPNAKNDGSPTKLVEATSLDQCSKEANANGNVEVRKGNAKWADLLKEKAVPSINLSYIDHGCNRIFSGENVPLKLKVPKDLGVEGKQKWENTLVGHFIGKKLPFTLVKNAASRFWGKFGLEETLATDSGFFFFKFSSAGARDEALEGGPWHIAGQPIFLRKWQPQLKLEKGLKNIPIWVKFFYLPMEYWDSKGLSYIASIIGKPLHVDHMTASGERITFARVCIEVSAESDFIKEFELEIENEVGDPTLISIEVEYQWTPTRCSKCKLFGHNCNKPVAPSMPPVPRSETARKNHEKPKDDEEWVEVVRKKGKNTDLKKKIEVPVSAQGSQIVNLEVDLGFTRQFLDSTSKEIVTSNSFKSLGEEVKAATIQSQPDDLEEASGGEEVTLPPVEECFDTPKLKSISYRRRENKRKSKGPKGGFW